MGDASVVQRGQQSQQGAVLTGVQAGAARVRAAGVDRLARTEGEAGNDAVLAPPLHCSEDRSLKNKIKLFVTNRLKLLFYCRRKNLQTDDQTSAPRSFGGLVMKLRFQQEALLDGELWLFLQFRCFDRISSISGLKNDEPPP